MSVRSLLLALVTAAALVAGRTPEGFTPGTDTDLVVLYGRVAPPDGAVVDKAVVGSTPVLGTERRLPPGREYAVIMVDLDVPFDDVHPHVLLHWLQTGLRPAATASDDNDERRHVFALHDAADHNDDDNDDNEDESPNLIPPPSSPPTLLAAYLPPSPPPRLPLSHRYVTLLIDTTALSGPGRAALADAAGTRLAFDVGGVLSAAGLTADRVVAGHYFNVTNPGPVDVSPPKFTATTTTTTTTTAAASKTSSSSSSSASPTSSSYPDDDLDDLLLGRNSSTGAGAAQPSGVNTGSAAAISSKAALAFSDAPSSPTTTAALPLLFFAAAAVVLGHAF